MKQKYEKIKERLVFDIYERIFKARITIIIGNYKDIKKVIPEEVSHHFGRDGYYARCAYKYVGGYYPYWVVIHSRSAKISVLAHEIIHAASFIFSEIGHKADWNDDEVLAHFVQYVLETVEDKLDA